MAEWRLILAGGAGTLSVVFSSLAMFLDKFWIGGVLVAGVISIVFPLKLDKWVVHGIGLLKSMFLDLKRERKSDISNTTTVNFNLRNSFGEDMDTDGEDMDTDNPKLKSQLSASSGNNDVGEWEVGFKRGVQHASKIILHESVDSVSRSIRLFSESIASEDHRFRYRQKWFNDFANLVARVQRVSGKEWFRLFAEAFGNSVQEKHRTFERSSVTLRHHLEIFRKMNKESKRKGVVNDLDREANYSELFEAIRGDLEKLRIELETLNRSCLDAAKVGLDHRVVQRKI